MSEIPTPPEPGNQPPEFPTPTPIQITSKPLSKKACAGIGFLIFVVSGGLSFVIPPLCLFGLAAVIASLFFKGYRFIFVGYILTVGLLLLGMIIYCSQYPPNFH